MQRLPTAAIALIVTGIAGCSSSPAAPRPPAGALPVGTAQVVVNGNDSGTIHDVECQTPGDSLTSINIGRNDGGISVLVDRHTPKAITFNDFGGLSGSYWQDLQGVARLDMVDQTYRFTGTAVGFNTLNPYTRTANSFTVKVAC
jgi:ipoprotein LpqH